MARSLGKMPTTSVRRLISLFKRSIAWSQYTFSACCAAEREDVAYFNVRSIDDDPVDQQLDEGAPFIERSMLKPVCDRGAEVLEPCGQDLKFVLLDGFGFQMLFVADQFSQSAFHTTTPRLKFFERQGLGLVRVHQPFDMSVYLRLPTTEVLPMCTSLVAGEPTFACATHCILEYFRVAE
jgi:hypothetical protein